MRPDLQGAGRGRAVTKNELIAAVADKTRMPRMLAAAAIDATFEIMTATLEQGDEVKITGFGNFRLINRAAREGRDPRTAPRSRSRPRKRPRFTPGKALKEAINR